MAFMCQTTLKSWCRFGVLGNLLNWVKIGEKFHFIMIWRLPFPCYFVYEHVWQGGGRWRIRYVHVGFPEFLQPVVDPPWARGQQVWKNKKLPIVLVIVLNLPPLKNYKYLSKIFLNRCPLNKIPSSATDCELVNFRKHGMLVKFDVPKSC